MRKAGSVCLLPQLKGRGGPASFQHRLKSDLLDQGIAVHHNPLDPSCAVILISGGTRQIGAVWKARNRGVKIVQRLAQGNWVHRARFSGGGHFYRSVRNNLLLAFIRRYLAHGVVYQSEFVRNFWQERFGGTTAEQQIIYNGVDLNRFSPGDPAALPGDPIRLIVVEGNFGGGNEPYLENAIRLGENLQSKLTQPVELVLVGGIPRSLQEHWKNQTQLRINWMGVVDREQIPEIDRSGHVFFSAELNAGCPNSVIEALACGLPVVGFETGSLPELVSERAGKTVPYGANYWELEPPDMESLTQAALDVLEHQPAYRTGARQRAEEAFNVHEMVNRYLNLMLEI